MEKKKSVYFYTLLAILLVLMVTLFFTTPLFIKTNWNWTNWLITILVPSVIGLVASCLASLWFSYIQQREYVKRTLRLEIFEQLTYYHNSVLYITNALNSHNDATTIKLELRSIISKKFFTEFIDIEYSELYKKKVELIEKADKDLDSVDVKNEHSTPTIYFDLAKITNQLLLIQDEFFMNFGRGKTNKEKNDG